ncbi:hypothetical protein LTR70_004720 [Exophiala xenobiotica]|uniref:Uncharacterized protein n=1 Tax=Lithohypha guttulata TaxID=1690604 RepID=A0ABR0KC75_9EURO|nr:hypothetical protein LTR24_004336 [Lithohypha guttulata]KAK5319934.1 hypothetical protein LTR70_004720 [Exophiala xenobiotica]
MKAADSTYSCLFQDQDLYSEAYFKESRGYIFAEEGAKAECDVLTVPPQSHSSDTNAAPFKGPGSSLCDTRQTDKVVQWEPMLPIEAARRVQHHKAKAFLQLPGPDS